MRHINPTTGDFHVRIAVKTATVGDTVRLLEIYAPYVENTATTFEDEVPSSGEHPVPAPAIISYPELQENGL